ncbi:MULTISPECIES: flagellar hook protein FlgE [unclassified Halomonas]|uniref:flagellar hook protein FlgE n=1 Tax=unclassified Halomonas TaxID=2609666 RepID=UPI0021E39EF3|nr:MULTISPECIES: flagellar hook protein FlgE [unclassified Halomonas]UYG00044.1 flagellar hook protein FlgE [Halomonas sp. GD1P12]WNL38868.1 flagellar hook protein FlgE [Halomonas sp. PAMB 3232]WNL42207.1 flagellar hook protein FlgE [Halomonas sp. PAMB 3264]
MSFSQALSGLNAQREKLSAIGNNIANSQTVGFKSTDVRFADVYAQSRIGLGVRTASVLQNFSQGSIESSSRNLDLAISGDGFFRFQQSNGSIGYSRNGQLTMTPTGELVNAQGAQIMGYPADAAGNVLSGGNVAPLSVDPGDLEASATSQLNMTLNLNSGQPAITGAAPTAAELEEGIGADRYTFSSNPTIFDSQGNARNLTLYFTKTGDNAWRVDGRLSGGPGDAQTYGLPGLTTLTFNQNGTLQGGGEAALAINGGEFNNTILANLDIDLNFAGTTQFANTSTVNDIAQNGYTSGSLVGISIQQDGTVQRNYSNEQSRAAGQVSLVSFRNPEGLQPIGDNLWSATSSSGQELIGAPGTGQRGLLQPGATENSNVDLAQELVDMIVSQRAYQANSQTISTQDELLQTIINL